MLRPLPPFSNPATFYGCLFVGTKLPSDQRCRISDVEVKADRPRTTGHLRLWPAADLGYSMESRFCSAGNARALSGTSPYLRIDESLRV